MPLPSRPIHPYRRGAAGRARVALLAAAALCSSLAAVATSPTTAGAQAGTVPLSVTVWRVVEIDNPDPGPFQDFGDYYANVTIGNVSSTSAIVNGSPGFGVGIVGSWTIEPFWNFSANVASNDTHVPVSIELVDDDDFLAGNDDPVDINPAPNKHVLDLTVNARNSTWRGDTLTGDRSVVGGGDRVERARIFFEISVGSTTGDMDGDGLLDGWERLGFDDNGDGVVDVNLPAFGANPAHKDLFVELDTMTGVPISRADLAEVKRAFALAPFDAGTSASRLTGGVDVPTNPDGTSGINLWIDTGRVIDPRVNEAGVEQVGQCLDNLDNDGDGGIDATRADRDMDGVLDPRDASCGLGEPFVDIVLESGVIPTPPCADGLDNDGDGVQDASDPQCWIGDNLGGGNDIAPRLLTGLDSAFYTLKGANFSGLRRLLFRYSISGHDGLEDGATTPNSCLDRLDNGGDGMADRADPDCTQAPGGQGEIGGNDFVELNHDGGTFLHELGHTLNLRHGGDENHNCKPNYVSAMNYDHQFGIQRVGGGTMFDFAPARLGGTAHGPAAVLELEETKLTEPKAINLLDSSNRTIYTDAMGALRTADVSAPTDWDGDGMTATTGAITADIDGPATGRAAACAANSGQLETLTTWDDWDTISLPFRHFADSASGAVNAQSEPPRRIEDRAAVAELLTQGDISLSLSGTPDPAAAGGTITYAAGVANAGVNPVDGVVVALALPAGVTFESGAGCSAAAAMVTCAIASLAPGQAATVQVVGRTSLGTLAGAVSAQLHATATATYKGFDTNVTDNTDDVVTKLLAVSDSAVASVGGVRVPGALLVGTPGMATVETVVTNGPTPADVEITQTAFTTSLKLHPTTTVSQLERTVRDGEQRRLRVTYTIECTQPGPASFAVEGRATMSTPGHLEPDGGNDERSSSFVIDCVIPVAINITPGDPANVAAPGTPFDVAILTTKAGEYKLPLDVDHTMLDGSSILFAQAQPPGPGFTGHLARRRVARRLVRARRRHEGR